MSRGFHAFFRQYYNLRSLLRRSDPALERLRAIEDYPLISADGMADSFARIPRTPPFSFASFVALSPSFTAASLAKVDVSAALELLSVRFPDTFAAYDGESAEAFLDRLRFPPAARHLALEVFARSFFAHPSEFSAGELVAMFHTYFLGSAEGLLFDVPKDDYDSALWAPLGRYLHGLGVAVRTGESVEHLTCRPDGVEARLGSGRSCAPTPAYSPPTPPRPATSDQRVNSWFKTTPQVTGCSTGGSPPPGAHHPSPSGGCGWTAPYGQTGHRSWAPAASVRSTT